MRSIKKLWICSALVTAMEGCAAHDVICDGHLLPINPPKPAAALTIDKTGGPAAAYPASSGSATANETPEMPHSLPVGARMSRPVTGAP